MKARHFLYVFIGILFTAFGAYLGSKSFQPVPPAQSTEGAIFQYEFPDHAGKLVRLEQFKGRTLVLNFWATWCPPCVEEMPELSELQQKSGQKSLQIIGIGIDSPKNIGEFAEKHKISYPLLVAGAGGTEWSRQLGNKAGGLPFTVIVEPSGKVKKSYLGRLNLEELERDLASH